jgi:hypothetical protein
VACGPSGLAVIDLDCHATLPDDWAAMPGVHDGADVFACLLEWAGEPRWPATTWVRTPSGGHHLYFRQSPGQEIRNSAGRLGPGVDVRGHGGYVIGPGSVVAGERYEVLDDSDPAPLPRWLARRLAPEPPARPGPALREVPADGRLAALARVVRGGQPGDRNGPLYWAACRAGEMASAGDADLAEAEECLVRAALEAGLRGGEREARATVRSGLRAGGGR